VAAPPIAHSITGGNGLARDRMFGITAFTDQENSGISTRRAARLASCSELRSLRICAELSGEV